MIAEEKILELFLFHNKLKFNEIEKLTKMRSNKLDYHLKKLIQRGVINKEKGYYQLNESSECIIPYLSDKKAVLPVILIKIGIGKNFFLYKRKKRPYKEKLSLPGGRMILGEDISQATMRIMKEKYRINAKLIGIDSISLEHIIKNKKIIHTFLLILVSAETKENISLMDITRNKIDIIPSDYKLMKKTGLNLEIGKIISKFE